MANINPAKTADLNKRLFDLQEKKFKEGDLSFFKVLESFITKYEGEYKLPESFTVGKVFDKKSIDLPQFHYSNFDAWILQSSKNRVIPVDLEGHMNLGEKRLGQKLNCRSAFRKIDGRYFSQKNIWFVMFALMCKPRLGRAYFNYQLKAGITYLLYVNMTSDEILLITIRFCQERWELGALNLDSKPSRECGDVLLYPC